mgnify:CR=1 FL=1
MPNIPPFPAVTAGLLTAFVGFASSFAVVLQGLSAVGADPGQAASGLMALSGAQSAAVLGAAILQSLETGKPS